MEGWKEGGGCSIAFLCFSFSLFFFSSSFFLSRENFALAHCALAHPCQLSFPKAAGGIAFSTRLLRQTGGGASGVEIPCKEL